MFYTIIGTQWGDEGKGKIVDWLSSKADYVVRFQGEIMLVIQSKLIRIHIN